MCPVRSVTHVSGRSIKKISHASTAAKIPRAHMVHTFAITGGRSPNRGRKMRRMRLTCMSCGACCPRSTPRQIRSRQPVMMVPSHHGMRVCCHKRHDGLQPHRYGANQSPRFLFASRHWAHFTLIQSHLPACKARSCVSTRCLRARAARIRQGAAFTDSVASPSSWLLIGV
jgi:hypothetical protein